MALLGFYQNSSLFTSHVTIIHAGAHDNRHCERECMRWDPERKIALIIFGCLRVQTQAAWVAGKCFFYYSMPLGQYKTKMNLTSKSRLVAHLASQTSDKSSEGDSFLSHQRPICPTKTTTSASVGTWATATSASRRRSSLLRPQLPRYQGRG